MDHHALVHGLVNEVRANTVAYLQVNQTRLIRCVSLIERFDAAYRAWSEQPTLNARQITETINELLIAKQFLQDEFCASVEYEPPLDGSEKSIDFLFHTTEGKRIFYDVKTIHPEDRDRWERYQEATEEGRFTEGTQLILDKAWDGGVLAHHRFASRQKFLEHTLELEEKIRHVPNRQDGTYFRMVFCGDGFRWRLDQLEDFADTYFRRGSSWDHFAKMQAHHLSTHGLTLERTIESFCYFERRYLLSELTKFVCDVRVPRLPRD